MSSAGAVDVSAVFDAIDGDEAKNVIDLTYDTQLAAASAVETLELEAKGATHPIGVLGHGSVDELKRCEEVLLREPVEVSSRLRKDRDDPGHDGRG